MLEPSLQPLVEYPGESLSAEYKDWLDLTSAHGRATLAKHAIALANHGGGYIVMGFSEQAEHLVSHERPAGLPEITQDAVNGAISHYADSEFQCHLRFITRSDTGVPHPVIAVPGDFTAPVMSKRAADGVIHQRRAYIRKPGPRSEEPQTHGEWKELIERCVRAGRVEMLDAIRSIVTGQVEQTEPIPDLQETLSRFRLDARDRWIELISDPEVISAARFPLGYHEIGLSLVGATPTLDLNELRFRLDKARNATVFSGWPLFLNLDTTELGQRIDNEFIEAWVGRPVARRIFDEPSHLDFWRVSRKGQLYSIRGYLEDSVPEHAQPGTLFDVRVPAKRVGEALIFASRLASTFEGVEQVALQCRFTGLTNRHLTFLGAFGVWPRFTLGQSISHTPDVELQGLATLQQIDGNLTEVVHNFLYPLYERFGFYQLPVATVQGALQEMCQ